MKTLLLYKDMSHARPFVEAHEELAKLGVYLRSVRCEGPKKALSASRAAPKIDLLVSHQELLSENIFRKRCPVVSMDRIDGAQLAGSRKWLAAGKLAGVLKSYTLRPAELNNQFTGRVFTHTCKDVGLGARKETRAIKGTPEQLTGEQLDKIHLIYGFNAGKPMRPFAKANPQKYKDRKHDIHFAGTVAYGGTEIDAHRRACVQRVKRISRGFVRTGRPMQRAAYIQTLLQSKSVVSPWGCGEACWRDYEALLCECALIKPETRHVAASPDIFTDDVCYFCKPDFSDLRKVLDKVLSEWDAKREHRAELRQMILATRSHKAIAAQLAPILKGFAP